MYDIVNLIFWWDILYFVVDEKWYMYFIFFVIIKYSDNFYIFFFICGLMFCIVFWVLVVNWWINLVYWIVVELFIVVLIGMFIKKRIVLSKWKKEFFWKGFYFGCSLGVLKIRNLDGLMYIFNVDDDYFDNVFMVLDFF